MARRIRLGAESQHTQQGQDPHPVAPGQRNQPHHAHPPQTIAVVGVLRRCIASAPFYSGYHPLRAHICRRVWGASGHSIAVRLTAADSPRPIYSRRTPMCRNIKILFNFEPPAGEA
jgi:hypothetical protein